MSFWLDNNMLAGNIERKFVQDLINQPDQVELWIEWKQIAEVVGSRLQEIGGDIGKNSLDYLYDKGLLQFFPNQRFSIRLVEPDTEKVGNGEFLYPVVIFRNSEPLLIYWARPYEVGAAFPIEVDDNSSDLGSERLGEELNTDSYISTCDQERRVYGKLLKSARSNSMGELVSDLLSQYPQLKVILPDAQEICESYLNINLDNPRLPISLLEIVAEDYLRIPPTNRTNRFVVQMQLAKELKNSFDRLKSEIPKEISEDAIVPPVGAAVDLAKDILRTNYWLSQVDSDSGGKPWDPVISPAIWKDLVQKATEYLLKVADGEIKASSWIRKSEAVNWYGVDYPLESYPKPKLCGPTELAENARGWLQSSIVDFLYETPWKEETLVGESMVGRLKEVIKP